MFWERTALSGSHVPSGENELGSSRGVLPGRLTRINSDPFELEIRQKSFLALNPICKPAIWGRACPARQTLEVRR